MAQSKLAVIPPEHMNYAGRVCENYAVRKVFRWEDKAALANYRLLKSAQVDIREYAYHTASQLRITEVGNDANSITFRRMLNRHITERLGQFAHEVAAQSYQYAVTTYTAGWYLRQWQMHQALHKPANFTPKRLPAHVASASVLVPGITEAVRADMGMYDYAGNEWRDAYLTAATAGILKAKGAVNRTMTKPASVGQVVQDVTDTLGTDSDNPKGLYHSTQLNTRAAVIRSFSHSSAEAYGTHVEWLVGAMWITRNDGRVCPQCARQNGRVFVVNDLFGIALLGLPPDGTHYGCRCDVIPLMIPVEKPNEPPADSFDEWLDEWGFYDELDVFMDDTQLESTMV